MARAILQRVDINKQVGPSLLPTGPPSQQENPDMGGATIWTTQQNASAAGYEHVSLQLRHSKLWCLTGMFYRFAKLTEAITTEMTLYTLQNAVYRQYTLYSHRYLERGNCKIVLSCVVWKVHERYPAPVVQTMFTLATMFEHEGPAASALPDFGITSSKRLTRLG